jgi:dihydrofolate reductase
VTEQYWKRHRASEGGCRAAIIGSITTMQQVLNAELADELHIDIKEERTWYKKRQLDSFGFTPVFHL